MQVFYVLLAAIVFASCQLSPVKTVPVERDATEVNQSFDVEEIGSVIDVATAGLMDRAVLVSSGQRVTFKNSSEATIQVSYSLDRNIMQTLQPQGQFFFKYPSGYERVEFLWPAGGVVLERRD